MRARPRRAAAAGILAVALGTATVAWAASGESGSIPSGDGGQPVTILGTTTVPHPGSPDASYVALRVSTPAGERTMPPISGEYDRSSVSLIGESGGQAYYRMRKTTGETCWLLAVSSGVTGDINCGPTPDGRAEVSWWSSAGKVEGTIRLPGGYSDVHVDGTPVRVSAGFAPFFGARNGAVTYVLSGSGRKDISGVIDLR